MGEWLQCRVQDVAHPSRNSLVGGPFGSDLVSSDYTLAGVPVIRGQNMSTRWIEGDFVYVSPEKAKSLSANLARQFDLIFTQRGTLGQVALVPISEHAVYLISQSQMKLTVDPSRADSLFLYYLFRSPEQQDYIRNNAIQTGVPHTNLGILRETPIALPPLREQQAISSVLGVLDDKIELNRRMSEALTATARELFKSWFIAFDPVRAKFGGQPANLPSQLDGLFPGALAESEIGHVPSGWSVGPLERFFDAVKGLSYKGSGLSDEGMPLHNLNSVYEGGGYKYEGLKHYNGDYGERHKVVAGDVIVANTEQGHDRLLIGYAAIIPKMFGQCGIASHHIFRLRPKPGSPLTGRYLCMLLNSPEMHDIVSGYANGTTVNMLPIDGVQKPQIVVPPNGLIRAFDALAQSIFDRCEEAFLESKTLSNLRDTLLPKLISGELRIKDAERFVGNVA